MLSVAKVLKKVKNILKHENNDICLRVIFFCLFAGFVVSILLNWCEKYLFWRKNTLRNHKMSLKIANIFKKYYFCGVCAILLVLKFLCLQNCVARSF